MLSGSSTGGMNAFVSSFHRKWVGFIRSAWTVVTETSERRLSTLPPEPVAPEPVAPEPVVPSKQPFRVELVGGQRYSWCSCGHSRKQPFCDGAHKTRAPGLAPLRFVPEDDAAVWLCGCKHTGDPPYCDGTHKLDRVQSAPLHVHADS